MSVKRFCLLLLPTLLLGQESGASKPVEFLAETVERKEDGLEARGDVTVISGAYQIRSDSATYDQSKEIIQFRGNVQIVKNGVFHLHAERAKVNIRDDSALIEPFYVQDSKTGFWVSAEKAEFKNDTYLFESAVLTSCCTDEPIWHMEVSEGSYDVNSSWISTWNPKLYVKEVPVGYLPYFAYSGDTRRRSGLLVPNIGLSESDGFIYQQPIYFALADDWDVEIKPQIRTKRGEGAAVDFRFVDSAISDGSFSLGYFKEKSSYHKEFDLKHSEHWKIGLEYKNESLLNEHFSFMEKDGVYADILLLSDLESENLQAVTSEENIEDKIVTSRLNYYMKDQQNYLGLYAKHYIDTSAVNNDTTLQNYPLLQYHRFTDKLLFDNVIYDVDANYRNFRRDSGLNAEQYEIEVPFSAYYPVLQDYLTLGVTQSLYLTKIYYSERDTDTSVIGQDDVADFARSFHRFSIGSDLLRPYESGLHTVRAEALYTLPGYKTVDGYFADFISLPDEQEQLDIRLSHYFYDLQNQLRFYHRIRQTVFFKDYTEKYGELENEIRYRFNPRTMADIDLFYSHENHRIALLSTELSYNDKHYDLMFSHYYENRKEEEEASYLNASADYKLRDMTFSGKIQYDYSDQELRRWSLGYLHQQRCFDYELTFEKDTSPILTNNGASSVEENGLYFEFTFKPIGGSRNRIYSVEKG